jgi:urease accessory protein
MQLLDTRYDAASTDAKELETLVVDDDQRRRSRFRASTEDGREVGVVTGGGDPLETGDVIGTEEEPVAVVELDAQEAAVVDLTGIDPTTDRLLLLAELGHALGNRHRPMAVRGTELLVPVTDGRERLENELDPFVPENATVEFDSVDPGLFDDAQGAHEHGHTHGSAEDHDHSHGADDEHDHSHGDGHDHDHSHDHADYDHSHDHEADDDGDRQVKSRSTTVGLGGPLTDGLITERDTDD